MAKNSKTEQNNGAASIEGANGISSSPTAPAPVAKKAKSAKKPAARKTAAKKKKPAASAAKKRAVRPPTKASEPYEPSDSEIRLRAYFIAERRAQLFLEGDPSNDWLEAREQLLKEAGLPPAE